MYKLLKKSLNIYLLKYFIIHFPDKYVFSGEILDDVITNINEKSTNEESITINIMLCQKIITSNYQVEGKYIAIISDSIFKSSSLYPNKFIEGCTLMGEILVKLYNEEVQDKFFEKVLFSFKKLISKNIEKSMIQRFETFLCTIVKKMNNSNNMFNIENFLIFIDNFQTDVKLNICTTIINSVLYDINNKYITDTYLAYIILKISKYIYDSLLFNKNYYQGIALKSSNENISLNNNISNILPDNLSSTNLIGIDLMNSVEVNIVNLIRKIDFGLDYETYFNYLGEVRSNIFDLDNVTETIILEVQKICCLTYKILKGKHTKKSLRFLKLCISFCQITIPSLKTKHSKIKHFLLTAGIALSNNFISECDSLIKNTINILSNMFNSDITLSSNANNNYDYNFFINTIRRTLSQIVIVPGNPESPFQLVIGIINIFNDDNLDDNINKDKLLIKTVCLFDILKYLTTQLQIKLPYRIKYVDSNDEIFLGEESYNNEAVSLIISTVEDILGNISLLDEKLNELNLKQLEVLSFLCYDICNSFKRYLKLNKSVKNIITKMKELGDKYLNEYSNSSKALKYKIVRLSNFKNSLEDN